MRTSLSLAFAACALQGCIIYDHDCPGCDSGGSGREDRPDRNPWDTADEGDDPAGDDTAPPEDPDAPAYALTMTPDQAEQGEVFIGSLRSSGEDALDLGRIADLRLYGDLAILATDLRSSELLLTVQVEPEARIGAVDLLAALDDGAAVWQPGLLTIFPAGSGHEAGSSDDGDDPCE
jgi:hypothetical protein